MENLTTNINLWQQSINTSRAFDSFLRKRLILNLKTHPSSKDMIS